LKYLKNIYKQDNIPEYLIKNFGGESIMTEFTNHFHVKIIREHTGSWDFEFYGLQYLVIYHSHERIYKGLNPVTISDAQCLFQLLGLIE
jgi:hypothetical protein